MKTEIAHKNQDKNWALKHFSTTNVYIEETLKTISAICVMKDNMPVEKYENIGFLFDVFDYQIINCEKILKQYSDSEIQEHIKGGKAEVLATVEKLKKRKMNDFLRFNNSFDEIGDYGDLSDKELQMRIDKMVNKEVKVEPKIEKSSAPKKKKIKAKK